MTFNDVILAAALAIVALVARGLLERNGDGEFIAHIAIGSGIGALFATIAMSPIVQYGKMECALIFLAAYFFGDLARRLYAKVD